MAAEVRQAVDHAERLIEVLLILARNDQARVLTDRAGSSRRRRRRTRGTYGQRDYDDHHARRSPGDRRRGAARTARRQPARQRRALQHRRGTIAISTTTDNGASLVRVVNTGRVVPPDQVDRLFLPFTRLDDRTRHDGFGLGLALVSSIATVHSGTVHATALITGGLDITVRLPRRYPQEQDDRAQTEPQKAARLT